MNRFLTSLAAGLLGLAMFWPGASASSSANAQGKANGPKKDGIGPSGKTGKQPLAETGLDRSKTVVISKPKTNGNGPAAKNHVLPVAAGHPFSKADQQHLRQLLGPDRPVKLTAAQGGAVQALALRRPLTQKQRNTVYALLDSRAPGMTLERRLALGRGLREDIDRKARMHSQGDTEPLARLLDPGSRVQLAHAQRLGVQRLLAGSLLTHGQRQTLFAMLRHRRPPLSAGQRLCIVRCMRDDTVRCAGVARYCSGDGTDSANPDGGTSPGGDVDPKREGPTADPGGGGPVGDDRALPPGAGGSLPGDQAGPPQESSGARTTRRTKPTAGGRAAVPARGGGPGPGVKSGPTSRGTDTAVQPARLIVLPPAEEKKIQEATGRALEYLKKVQDPKGCWTHSGTWPAGATALVGLTLLECQVKAGDPAVQKAARCLREAGHETDKTYELALAILFFDRLADDRDGPRIQELALRLVAGQSAAGGWTYTCPTLTGQDQDQLLKVLKGLRGTGRAAFLKSQASLVASLTPRVKGVGVLQDGEKLMQDARTQPDEFFRGGGDNSNVQFALLALWTARRHRLPVEPALALVARRFRASQDPDGSWNYSGRQNSYALPSMTCAGLLGLAVGYGLSEDGAAGNEGGKPAQTLEQDAAVQKALQLLGRRIGEARKDAKAPSSPMVQMYFLWSVERVAVLYQLKAIGGERWYLWGRDMLAAHQQPDGHWEVGGANSSPVVDTCFALLFLQQVNLFADLTEKLPAKQSAGGAAGNVDSDAAPGEPNPDAAPAKQSPDGAPGDRSAAVPGSPPTSKPAWGHTASVSSRAGFFRSRGRAAHRRRA